MSFIILESLNVALYGIATVIFKGIRTLNVTNLSRKEDTKCHKRYHAEKNPSPIVQLIAEEDFKTGMKWECQFI